MKYRTKTGFCVFRIIEGGMKAAVAVVKQGQTSDNALFEAGDVVVVDDNERIDLPDGNVLIHEDKVLAVVAEGETDEEQEALEELKSA